MKLKIILPAVVLLFLCKAVLMTPAVKKEIIAMPAGIHSAEGGIEDDAEARYDWERMRLADPATGRIPPGIHREELAFAYGLPKLAVSNPTARLTTSIVQRGPWNVGGRTRAIAIDVTDENIIFTGSVNGGLWRSTDAGVSWTRVSPKGDNPSITFISQDTRPGHTNTWYYSTGEGYGASASGGGAYYLGNGIYKSIDGGITWSSITYTASGTPHTFDNVWDLTWRVLTDPSNASQDVVYAASYGAIFRSINGGTTWALQVGNVSGSSFSYFTDIAITTTGVVYATLSTDDLAGGIYRRDPVTSWVQITPPGLDTATINRMVIGINPQNENEVFFLGETPYQGKITTNYKGDSERTSLWKYTYLSGNGSGAGGQWDDRSANIPYDSSQLGNFNSQGGYDLMVKVHPLDSNIVFIGGTNLFRSTDGFKTSLNTTLIGGYNPTSTIPFYVNYLENHSDQHDVLFYPSNPLRMLQASDGGIYRTDSNTAGTVVWEQLNHGYLTSQFYTVAIDHGSVPNDIIIGGLQDNGTWFTNNTSLTTPWNEPGWGDGSYCAIDDGHLNYYTSRQLGKTVRSQLDANGNVIAFGRMDPIGGSGYLFINPFTLDPNNNNRMYLLAGSQVWRNDSLDQIPMTGQWDSISTGWSLLPDSIAALQLTALAVCKTPANRIYYGSESQRVFRLDSADTSTPTLTEITSTQFNGLGYVSCIAVDPYDGDRAIVVFSNYRIYSLFYTTDGGTSWTKIGGNLETSIAGTGAGPSLRWATFVPTGSGYSYIVGTSIGLYGTNQLNGLNTVWTNLSPNEIGYSVVDMMDYRESDGLLAIATHGAGMFSVLLTDTLMTSTSIIDPFSFDATVFPNPSTRDVTVRYTIPFSQHITIGLYNGKGDLVRNISNEYAGAGDHKHMIRKGDLASGIYYLKIENDQHAVQVRKVVLMD